MTFNGDGATAQAVVQDKVQKRVLKTGLISGDRVEIKEGLAEGDLSSRAPARSCATATPCGLCCPTRS